MSENFKAAPPTAAEDKDQKHDAPVRFQKTSQLITTELYQRRKRNLFLFTSVVVLVTLTDLYGDIPLPLLGEEVKLSIELVFFACAVTTLYFAWEFYVEWETARRRNAEDIQSELESGKELGSELHRLITTTSEQFSLTGMKVQDAIKALKPGAKEMNADTVQTLTRATSILDNIAKEFPRWRSTTQQLLKSYRVLHQSVSHLQQINFFIDLVLATALTTVSVGASGYLILKSFVSV